MVKANELVRGILTATCVEDAANDGVALARRVEKVLAMHLPGGGWACELCQTHLPCPTRRALDGEE